MQGPVVIRMTPLLRLLIRILFRFLVFCLWVCRMANLRCRGQMEEAGKWERQAAKIPEGRHGSNLPSWSETIKRVNERISGAS